MIRVLLVDDHAVLRTGFRMILEAQDDIAVVGEASTGAQAVAAASALRPDVICMDVQMPDMDGIAATRLIVADPDVDVIRRHRHDLRPRRLPLRRARRRRERLPAQERRPEELVSAVRVVAGGRCAARSGGHPAGHRAVRRPAAGRGSDDGCRGHGAPTARRHTGSRRSHSADGCRERLAEPLTEREAEVLRLLAQAMSNAEIARRLYIGEATVKTHVSKVLQKLGARDRVQAAVIAHRRGLT